MSGRLVGKVTERGRCAVCARGSSAAKRFEDLARVVVRVRFALVLFRGYQRFPIISLLQARSKTKFWILLKYQNDPEASFKVPSSTVTFSYGYLLIYRYRRYSYLSLGTW
jgi:hypothetical protein